MDQFAKFVGFRDGDIWSLKGLLVGYFVCVGAAISLKPIIADQLYLVAALFSMFVFWSILWFSKNKIGYLPKNRIGVVICICGENRDVDRQIRSDYLPPLNDELKKTTSGLLEVLVLPFHIATRYEDFESAKSLKKKCNARFILYGKARKRGERYIVDLSAELIHRQLDPVNQAALESEISSSWIGRHKLSNAEETFEIFEISSNLTATCSKYLIGLGCAYSGLISPAEKILEDVRSRVEHGLQHNLPQVRTIKKQLATWLNRLYTFQARLLIDDWTDTRSTDSISSSKYLLDKVYGVGKKEPEFLTLSAICSIIIDKDFKHARGCLNAIPEKSRKAIWYLNKAFVEAGIKNENGVIHLYSKAESILNKDEDRINLEKISEFEDFICWYNSDEGDEYMLFLLGMINDRLKGDTDRAVEDYKKFVDWVGSFGYPASRKIAERFLEKTKLKKSKILNKNQ